MEENEDLVGRNEYLLQFKFPVEDVPPEELINDFNSFAQKIVDLKTRIRKMNPINRTNPNSAFNGNEYLDTICSLAEYYYSLAEIGFILMSNSSLCDDDIAEWMQSLHFNGLNTIKSPMGAPLVTEVLAELNSYVMNAMNLCDLAGYVSLKPYIFLLRANIMRSQNDSWSALNNYSLALIASKELIDAKNSSEACYASILAEFGHFYFYQLPCAVFIKTQIHNQMREAGIHMIKRAIQILESLSTQENREVLGSIYHELALVQYELKLYEDALASLNTSLTIYEKGRQMNKEIMIHIEIGKIQEQLKNAKGAIESYQTALTLSRQFGIEQIQSKILVSLALIFADNGDMVAFNQYIEQAEQLEQKNPLEHLDPLEEQEEQEDDFAEDRSGEDEL